MKIRNITINFWYKELTENPSNKVLELESNLLSLLHNNFMYSEMPVGENIDIPRIQCLSEDKKLFFTMSLVSSVLRITVDDMDNDQIVLFVNENMQLIYDVLKELYNIEFLYSSIKIEASKQDNKVREKLAEKFSLGKDEFEDVSIKRVRKVEDSYYEALTLNSTKEINYDINVPVKNPKENDLFSRSMLISTSDAKVGKEFLSVNYEINDRLAFNNDKEYLSTKESIRGLILEFKDFVTNHLNKLL